MPSVTISQDSGIYKLSTADGRCYVGSSRNIDKRLRAHWRALANGNHVNGRLQRAWNETKVLDIDILEHCPPEALKDREQHWIDILQSYLPFWGFNIERRANVKPHSSDTKRKIADSLRGRRASVQHRIKLSESHKGYKRSPEARKKQGETIKRHAISDATRQKISEANRGKHHNPWSNQHRDKFIAAMKGRAVSNETRQKISEANSGKKRGVEFRERQRALMRSKPGFFTGHHHSEETRQRISELKSNPSDETRRRMSEAAKRRRARERGDGA